MKVTEKDVLYVADLANLELTPEERARMVRDLNSILEYVDRLNELDTSGVPPMAQVSDRCGVPEKKGIARFEYAMRADDAGQVPRPQTRARERPRVGRDILQGSQGHRAIIPRATEISMRKDQELAIPPGGRRPTEPRNAARLDCQRWAALQPPNRCMERQRGHCLGDRALGCRPPRGRCIREREGHQSRETLAAIRESFDREMESPTSETEGNFVQ